MKRYLILAAVAAACLFSASCRFLHMQKTPDSVPTEQKLQDQKQTAEEAPGEQGTAPSPTEPGTEAQAASPVQGGHAPAVPSPDLPFTASAASVPAPGTLELPLPSVLGEPDLPDDADTLPVAPQPAPAAELRGLRSPKLPSSLPMSLDGKIRPSH